MSKSINMFI